MTPRKPRGSSDGGQFTRDTRGRDSVPTAAEPVRPLPEAGRALPVVTGLDEAYQKFRAASQE